MLGSMGAVAGGGGVGGGGGGSSGSIGWNEVGDDGDMKSGTGILWSRF